MKWNNFYAMMKNNKQTLTVRIGNSISLPTFDMSNSWKETLKHFVAAFYESLKTVRAK